MTRIETDNVHNLNLRKLNLRHFCRDGVTLELSLLIDDLPRVQESLSAAARTFTLHAQGAAAAQTSGDVQLQLTVKVQGSAPLVCQRCLERVDVAVSSEARFVLVNNEAEADAMEQESEEASQAAAEAGLEQAAHESEPLVADKPIDLIVLAEDEILLCLPLVPMHETCPQPLAMSSALTLAFEEEIEATKPNPFAVLASLKKH